MTITVANVTLNNSFDYWRQRTNDLALAVNNYVLTVNNNPTVGDAVLIGNFQSNTVYVSTSISGGTIGNPAALNFNSVTNIANNLNVSSKSNFTSNVGINKSNPVYELDVVGTIYANNILINGLQPLTSAGNANNTSYLGGFPANYYYNVTNASQFANSTNGFNINGNVSSVSVTATNGSITTLSTSRVISSNIVTGALYATGPVVSNGAAAFTGNSSTIGLALTNIAENAVVNTNASGLTGLINYDVTTQSVLYYTSNTTGSWYVNFRGSSNTALNTIMANGQVITVALLATNGPSTSFYFSNCQIDSAQTAVRWQNSVTPALANANSVDSYAFTIIKTANNTFTVLGAQTQFK